MGRPILRGAKITVFLLGVMFMSFLTSGVMSRPTGAVFLNSVVGCLLNIGVCPQPGGDVDDPETPPEVDDPGDITEPVEEPDETPAPEDTLAPTVSVAVNPVLAGGITQTVTITGKVADENLSSYTLALNGNTVQQANDITETEVTMTVPWNVAIPNKVPSGTYIVTLDVTDKAGNAAHDEKIVEVDNDGPTVSVTGGDVIIKSGSISPHIEADDIHGVASYYWTSDENNPGVIDFDAEAKEPSFKPYFEGTYVFYVAVGDSLGNVSTATFSFGYARQLATLPLPTTADFNGRLLDQDPSHSTVTAGTSAPTIRSSRDEITSSDEGDVLGNTVVAPENTAMIPVSTITPTKQGWSILGILWYWWLAVIALFFGAWMGIKKRVLSRIPENS